MFRFQHSYIITFENNSILFSSQWFRKEYRLSIKSAFKLFNFFQKIRVDDFDKRFFLKEVSEITYSSENAKKILNSLLSKHIIIRTTEKKGEFLGRYSRQELFLANFERDNLNGVLLNDELQNKKIVIVGLGGYGTWTTLLLSRIGIKNLALIDSDVVELSNLNRQVLYDFDDVGLKKVEVCKRKILAVDSSINVEIYDKFIESKEDLFPIISNADLVMNAFGYFPLNMAHGKSSFYVNEACIIKNVPCLNYNGSWIGPIFEGSSSPCYFCMMRDEKLVKAVKFSLPTRKYEFMPAFAPRVAFSSSIAAWEAVRFLLNLNGEKPLKNTMIVLDTLFYDKHSKISIKYVKNCKYCKKN